MTALTIAGQLLDDRERSGKLLHYHNWNWKPGDCGGSCEEWDRLHPVVLTPFMIEHVARALRPKEREGVL